MPLTQGQPSPDPAVANTLFTFLAQRFVASYGANGLNCAGLLNTPDPLTVTTDANGVAISAAPNTGNTARSTTSPTTTVDATPTTGVTATPTAPAATPTVDPTTGAGATPTPTTGATTTPTVPATSPTATPTLGPGN